MKIILLSFLAIFSMISMADAQCNGGRYASNVFTNVTATTAIQYGQNALFTGANQILTLDFYQPTGDTETKRPLIILAHGGSFQFGSSADGDVTYLCQEFARKGYACASINYRKGFFPLDSLNAVKAVIRAVQDMKAAVRFFYKDSKEGINQFKIDTNNIFVGGSSAGAITALHLAYLDKTCELNPYIPQAQLTPLGGIDGNSGNACYSEKIKGVINLCGALANYSWMEAGDVPLVSLHGTNDATVKYNRGIVNPGVPLIYLDGSRMLYEHSENIGIQHNFFTFLGAPHVPYAGTSATNIAYMDTTVRFVRDFLIDQLGCSDAPLQAPNATAETANLYAFTPCTTHVPIDFCALASIEEINDLIEIQLYPNPAVNQMKVNIAEMNSEYTLRVVDLTGREIYSLTSNQNSVELQKSEIGRGTFLLHISTKTGYASTQKIVFE
jgi:poly(3-hydroxybutyrate) depolymerase